MKKIETFVIMDLETTGLPHLEGNKTKITEISLVTVKREHILNTKSGDIPRVVHKLTRLVNPKRLISFESTDITGLCNELLENETDFKNTFDTIDSFLNLCTKPVCLVAHNGDRFDYPILRAEIAKIKKAFSDDILCIDSLKAFRDLDKQMENGAGDVASSPKSPLNRTLDPHTSSRKSQLCEDKNDLFEEYSFDEVDLVKIDELCVEAYKGKIQKINETTPPKQMSQESPNNSQTPVKTNRSSGTSGRVRVTNTTVKKRLPFSDRPKVKSYALNNIFERLFGRQPDNGHHAESDCLALLHCVVVKSKEFCDWSDENCKVFNQIAPMEVGRKIGM